MSEQNPKGTNTALILILALIASVSCFVLMLLLALIVREYRTLFLIVSCAVSVPMIGLGGFLIYTFASRPPEIIERVKEVDRPFPVWDENAHKTEGLLNQISEWFPELGKLWQNDFHEHMAEKAGVTHRAAPAEHIPEEKHWILQLFDKLLAFIQTPIGGALATQAVENLGEEGGEGGGGDEKRGPGCFSLRTIIIVFVAMSLCCCLIVGGIWLVNRSSSSPDSNAAPTLVPIPTVVSGAPTTGPLPTQSVGIPPTQGASAVAGQISATEWQVPCSTEVWCFNGYTSEGNVHLFPWLQATVAAQCTVPPSAESFGSWKSAQWEASTGYFYPLRDWYRTNYNKTSNLTSSAGTICAAFGGTTK